jgi:hypothetical protein
MPLRALPKLLQFKGQGGAEPGLQGHPHGRVFRGCAGHDGLFRAALDGGACRWAARRCARQLCGRGRGRVRGQGLLEGGGADTQDVLK